MFRNIFLKRNLSINQLFRFHHYIEFLIFYNNVSNQKYDFERRLCAQTQDLQILKKFYMPQMNPKEFVHKTAYSVQLPYIAGHSL